MRDLVLGCDDALRHGLEKTGRGVCFSAERGDRFTVAAILPGAAMPPGAFSCDTLLLWEAEAERWLGRVEARQAVSCGFAPQNTLTPASTEPAHGIVTVQRELRRPDGQYIWPGDVPIPEEWARFTLPQQLMLTGLRLLGVL